jgi:hypothetical protein
MHHRRSFILGILALVAFVVAGFSTPSQAQTGNLEITIAKAGWFIGAQAGSGTLTFRGRAYRLGVGGLSAGLTFGGSVTDLVGTARNLRRVSDIEGVYTAVGAGAAVAGGARVLQLQNSRGVVLLLRGRQVGLSFDLDLSGISISLR